MRIGILGSRGIPNQYGGFEQFAEYLSTGLVARGHEVVVYCSHRHPYKENRFQGVELVHCFDPEYKIGTAGQFVYDLNCILDSHRQGLDVLLQLGYTSSSIWFWLLPRRPMVLTNMDGLEWKRSKYSPAVQRFLKVAERLAVRHSYVLVADSLGIAQYLRHRYKVGSTFIPYGAVPFTTPNPAALATYNLQTEGYDMLIARLEPENSIEIILQGVAISARKRPFAVIGNYETAYGRYLKTLFSNIENIRFLGSLYDQEVLNNLRHYCHLYFHGHTVGGTNPSLLEAMASGACIVAHQNPFNNSVLGSDAFYFTTADEVKLLLDESPRGDELRQWQANNLQKIHLEYNWEEIVSRYEALFAHSLGARLSKKLQPE